MQKKYYKFDLDLVTMNIVATILSIIVFVYACLKIEINFFILTGLILYFFLHELFHGLGYSFFAKNKKNIKYGIILEKGVFYAMCQEEINKKGIVVSLLMPTIFLTLIPLPLALIFKSDILLFYALLNLIGASGDLCMFFLILKFPRDIGYIDYDNNIGAYFTSTEDLSKYRSFGMKYSSCGKHSENLINKDIKTFYVSKSSKIFIIIYLIILIITFLINMI